MAKRVALVDSSFLYATYNQNDAYHAQAIASPGNIELVIPQIILVETCYLLQQRANVLAVIQFLDSLTNAQVPLESIILEDVVRARDIMATYADPDFDFVDCCIMALSERLNITRVYTFDRRDFRIFRPRHCAFLELLP